MRASLVTALRRADLIPQDAAPGRRMWRREQDLPENENGVAASTSVDTCDLFFTCSS